MRSAAELLLLLLPVATAFQPAYHNHPTTIPYARQTSALPSHPKSNTGELSRKSFLTLPIYSLASSLLLTSSQPATANNYDGSIPPPPPNTAIYAYRSGGLPRLTTLGFTKLYTRFQGYVVAPSSGYNKSQSQQIPIAFDFPTDWLQLDKLGGGIQYVDQRNGDKLYVLHAVLPGGTDLKTVSKQWFADAILSPDGDIARSGVVAEGGRVSSSKMIVDCTTTTTANSSEENFPKNNCNTARRRMILKYDTVTGSGVQTVERRGLVDAHQVGENDVYMILTTSNAVKFDNKESRERETVETIVGSFKVGDAALL